MVIYIERIFIKIFALLFLCKGIGTVTRDRLEKIIIILFL